MIIDLSLDTLSVSMNELEIDLYRDDSLVDITLIDRYWDMELNTVLNLSTDNDIVKI